MPTASSAHRLLRLTSPLTSGEDVKALQRKLGVGVDGQFGPVTHSHAMTRALALGALESTIAKGCTVGMQNLIRDPGQWQTGAQEKRAQERRAAKPKGPIGGAAAIAWSRSKIGVKEHPAGSNGGPQIDAWERDAGMGHGPWCGAFARQGAHAGGVYITPEARYVPALRNHAKAHTGGYRGWFDANNFDDMVKFAKVGDHVCFEFTGDTTDDHVGQLVRFYRNTAGQWRVVTVDGNTAIGNDSNGGEVMERDRPAELVDGVAGVRWSA